MKLYCGYWRPWFLNECAFNATIGECTASDYDHAFRSFPSGHASTSVASMLHVTLRLLGATRVGGISWRRQVGKQSQAWASVDLGGTLTMLCLLPTLFGIWVAASRVHDNAHHPADVVGGSLIGGACALFWHARYFKPIFTSASHLPLFTDSSHQLPLAENA